MTIQWCRAGTIGDFDARLITVRLAARFVDDHQLSSKLMAVSNYHEHCFKSTVDQRYAKLVDPLKKQLIDLVRTMMLLLLPVAWRARFPESVVRTMIG